MTSHENYGAHVTLKRVRRFLLLGMVCLVTPCVPLEAEDSKALSLQHFVESTKLRQQAFEIFENPSSEKCAGITCSMNGEEWRRGMALLQEAGARAELVKPEDLNFFYPGWGTNFDTKFRRGLRQMLSASSGGGVATWGSGQQLLNEWATWYNANAAAIKRHR